MAELYELHGGPEVTGAPLLVGLDGWIDAGFAAGSAIATILEGRDAHTLATFDADALLDHRSRRPIMHIVDGVNTGITWPSIEVRVVHDLRDRPVVLLVGAEPDHRWHAFTDAVIDVHDDLGLDGIYALGAYPAPVPHTRPTRVISTSVDPSLRDRFGSVEGHIDVPAGIASVIEIAASTAGIDAATFWAQVPHYAAGMANPAAALALIEALRTNLDLELPLGTLVDDSRTNRTHLDELVANNDEHVAMVRALESDYDATVIVEDPLPMGDDIVAELEQFLREQD